MTVDVAAGLPVAAPRPPRVVGPVHWLGVRTMVEREIRRIRKEWLETLVAPVASTLLYFFVFALALGPDRATPEGEALLRFVVPGLMLTFVLTRAAETNLFSLVFDKLEGMMADILMAPLTAAELTAAYAMAGMIAGLVTGVPLVVIGFFLVDLPVAQPLLVVLYAAGGALMTALFGLLIGILSRRWDEATAYFGFILIPLAYLSGVFAPLAALPERVQLLVQLSPVFWVVDGFRAGFLGTSEASLPLGFAIVATVDAALWTTCWWLLRRGFRLKG